jgi:hypothetical protein
LGFFGNGITGYIDTDWNPTEDAGGLYTQNNCSSGFLFTNHRTTAITGGNGLINASSEGIICTPLFTGLRDYFAAQGYYTDHSATQNDYLITLSRGLSDRYTFYKNKTGTFVVRDSIALLNGNVYLLAYNLLGTGAMVFSTDTIGLYFAGSELDQIDVNVLNDALVILLT